MVRAVAIEFRFHPSLVLSHAVELREVGDHTKVRWKSMKSP